MGLSWSRQTGKKSFRKKETEKLTIHFGMISLIECPSLEQSLIICSELGLDFIEINMNLPEYRLERINTPNTKRLFHHYGKYPTIHLDENLDVCAFNAFVADAYMKTAIQAISAAKELNAPIINMHMSDGVCFSLPDKIVYLYEHYRAEYLDRLRQFRDTCTDAIGNSDVFICIENSGTYHGFQRTGIDLLLESPCFALTYDTGHDLCVGKSNEEFIIGRKGRLKHMHLHDAIGKKNHLVLGTGEIDIAAMISLAKEHNCRCVLEVKTSDGLRKSVEYLTRLPKAIEGQSVSNIISPTVTDNSTNDEKLDLFQSMFRGREDIHALRWINKDKTKWGYSPACRNDWIRSLCRKAKEKKAKCGECENSDFIPLSRGVLARHFTGKDVVGIYPLLTDESCLFLAIDFDGDEWTKDIDSLRIVCELHGIPFAVERSRSGNGAHVWFFFEEKISAYIARRFGSALLTTVMEQRNGIGFSTYDRFFPSQDTMPEGGFGNLIALPLQREVRNVGNSVFIDEHGKPFEDQWAFLSGLRHLGADELNKHIGQLCKSGELGPLRVEFDSGDEKPWQKKMQAELAVNDFPAKARIVEANMIFIEKEGFSAKALNRFKRLAAFSNPEFYKTQAMRFSTWNIPRIISCSEETEQYLCLPRGCKNDVLAMLGETLFQWEDERNKGRKIEVEFNGILRLEQGIALASLLSHENGILYGTTAFGKTVVGAALIAEHKVNTLVIVGRQPLLDHWMARLAEFLTINESLAEFAEKRGGKKRQSIIGLLGGGKNNLGGIIDIAMFQSLVRGDEVKELVKDYGMVIVDECHHIAAAGLERVLKNTNAKYVYGLTATPKRLDGHHPIVIMQCGDIRYKDDAKLQAQNRPFEHYFIPRFTSYRLPIDKDSMKIQDVFTDLCQYERRNSMIIDDILQAISDGRNPLVLTERKTHVDLLKKALKDKIPGIIVLTGGKSSKERKRLLEQVISVPEDQPLAIIAIGRFIGEGFDASRLDTLFLAMPFSWEGTLAQYAGRLHRLHDGKDEVLIYDYVDVHVARLERMYTKRIKGYTANGYRAKCEGVIPVEGNIIFDSSSFLSVFSADINAAKCEIVIVSPYLTRKRVSKMIDILAPRILSDVKIIIVTRPARDYSEKDKGRVSSIVGFIRDKGIAVVERSRIHQKFAIIDDRVVWYGSINLLSFGGAEESIMRLDSATVAVELMSVMRDWE